MLHRCRLYYIRFVKQSNLTLLYIWSFLRHAARSPTRHGVKALIRVYMYGKAIELNLIDSLDISIEHEEMDLPTCIDDH